MSAHGIRVSREWLSLREPADAAARARDLLEVAAADVPGQASNGAAVSVEPQPSDITSLHQRDSPA